jgi:hypothetical protein
MGFNRLEGSTKFNVTCNVPVVNPLAAQLIVNAPAAALPVHLNIPELLMLTPTGALDILHVGLVSASPLLLVPV